MCRAFNTLPATGGLFDQNPRAILRMQKVLEAQALVDERESKQAESKKRLEEKVASGGH